MVIGIMGENCTGKSTLADELKNALGAKVFSGRDYLRLAKSEPEAGRLFAEKLKNALNGENIIYVITEKELVGLLPEGAVRILVTADIDTIKARFRERMHGVLPPPVEAMLEKKHGSFDALLHDYHFDGVNGDAKELSEELIKKYGKGC